MNVSLRKRGQSNASGLPVVHDFVRIIEGDHFDHRSRLRRVVADLVAVCGCDGFRTGQTHQRIAVRRRHVHAAAQQFLHGEARELRREFGAAGEDACDARSPEYSCRGSSSSSAKRFKQLWRREHAADIVAGVENGDGLLDHVRLVSIQVFDRARLDQLDDPARIEVDAKADAAAVLAQDARRQAAAVADRRARASASSSRSGKYSSGRVSPNNS